MESDIKILKLLLGNKEERITIRKISKKLSINYRIAYEKVVALEKEGLITVIRAGNSKLCGFSDRFDYKVYEAEYKRRADLFKDKNFWVIQNRLSELKFPFIVLLFGSYAKGTNVKHSDIDILTIGGDQKEIGKTLSLLPNKIHLTQVTYEEFIGMAKSKEFTAVSEAIKNNVILIGIEEYYRLLENAK